jgi:hypothetical protein
MANNSNDAAKTAAAEEAAKVAAEKKAAADKVAAEKAAAAKAAEPTIAPVKSVLRIDNVITPGIMFTPATETQRKELLDLEAVAELNEAELALAEKIKVPTYGELTKANEVERARVIAEQNDKDLVKNFVKAAITDAVSKVADAAADADF